MICYNKRLNQRAEVAALNFTDNKASLIKSNSNPKFIYTEKLSNICILEDTGVKLNNVSVYVNDIIIDEQGKKHKVKKVPGGYYPFMLPNKQNFKVNR